MDILNTLMTRSIHIESDEIGGSKVMLGEVRWAGPRCEVWMGDEESKSGANLYVKELTQSRSQPYISTRRIGVAHNALKHC